MVCFSLTTDNQYYIGPDQSIPNFQLKEVESICLNQTCP